MFILIRIEGYIRTHDETRQYAERLIELAKKYGDRYVLHPRSINPMLDFIRFNGGSYRIPGQGIASIMSETDPIVQSDECRRVFFTVAKPTARKICNI